MQLNRINNSPAEEIRQDLFNCCGSEEWVEQMLARRPFTSVAHLFNEADEIWRNLPAESHSEAFRHHPKIGDVESLRNKFAQTRQWASGEQSGVAAASDKVLVDLKRGNDEYEKRFGFIFIVCATGKTADEMLALLKNRLPNSTQEELAIAAAEQNKITRIRLEKLCTMTVSPITTHILDTAQGRPAVGVPLSLHFNEQNGSWTEIGQGTTNNDGRVANLLPAEHVLKPGIYKIKFETSIYFHQCGLKGFYPYVEVAFEIEKTGEHYHVPLLLNPFGYSTYRGS